MKRARTSNSHPLQIATIEVPDATGAIGITLCPGKKDPGALSGAWDRNLGADLAAVVSWGAKAIVCLVEDPELELLKVEALPKAAREAGLEWFHLPIRDVDVPNRAFENAWRTKGRQLRQMLTEGHRVLIHCRGGLGRSGTIAARLLVELGLEAEAAISIVRRRRPGAIETLAQEQYVRHVRPLLPSRRIQP